MAAAAQSRSHARATANERSLEAWKENEKVKQLGSQLGRYLLYLRMALAVTVAGAALALGGCGLAPAGTTSDVAAPTLTPLPSVALATPTPNAKTAVQQTVVQFCQNLSDSKLNEAYALLTTSFQQRAHSAANLPNVLKATWGKTTGCMEFGNGGFIQVSGDHANDTVLFTVTSQRFGTQQINSALTLAQSGGAWRIDSNT